MQLESVVREGPFPAPHPQVVSAERARVRGKFLFAGEEKLWLRGVTYGTFRPREDGHELPSDEQIERDFALMAANGFNTVRTYTAPPRSVLDAALRHGLRLMVGLCGERWIGTLCEPKSAPDFEERVRADVRRLAGHPAVLCYAVGNEIPAPLVRLHGRRKVEGYIERLCRAVKAEDPEALVTYVSYPTTEYLELPCLDLVCFNVYLEQQERFRAYLARLQNLAGDRPLVMSEVGLDSLRNGELAQAHTLAWQVRTALEAGCAGAYVYSWTDEWFRGGEAVQDWKFGLTDQERRPKPALRTVREAFDRAPFAQEGDWPRISVVVCSYNGARTIRDCLEALRRVDYPDFEVIVVDDGSTDHTAQIAREYEVTLIQTENRGLSSARNTGLAAATGEIVAYIDDDAWPDPHWLTFLAHRFRTSTDAGVGGPNIPPPGDGPIAECVANAPGGPIHVLLDDELAEHIPGCNMAFRRECLEAIGGFDPQFRSAGDDVDLCWRLQERGWTLGFSAAAMVWHHRRASVGAYWRHQRGYGQAEAMLERKWPGKYNAPGHLSWAGRVYGQAGRRRLGLGWRVYHGTWGAAPFQSLYAPGPSVLSSLLKMPEWYLLLGALGALAALGLVWRPMLALAPAFLSALLFSLFEAGVSGAKAVFAARPPTRAGRLKLRLLTALLHLLQPAARLRGRLRHGLTPWRRRGPGGFALPLGRLRSVWSERWVAPEVRLETMEAALRGVEAPVARGGDFDRWDLEVRGGLLGAARVRVAVEEHGGGRQYVRLRSWPVFSATALGVAALLGLLAGGALLDGAWFAGGALLAAALGLVAWCLADGGRACAVLARAVEETGAGGGR